MVGVALNASRHDWGALLLACAFVSLTAASIVIQAASWMPPLDDAYIHAAFAQQLAEGGTRLPGQAPGGESSPGFAALLALAELGPLRLAPQFALLLGAMAFVALPLCVARLLPPELKARVVVAYSCAVGGPLLFHAQSGMETLPYLTLGVASLFAFARRRFRLAGLFAACAAWLRLDAWALWLALAIGAFEDARRCGESRREAIGGFARDFVPGLLLTALAPLLMTWWADGFPPATLAGRRWLERLDPVWTPSTVGEGLWEFVRGWLRALSAQFGFGNLAPHLPDSLQAAMTALRWIYKFTAALLLVDGLRRLLGRSMRHAESAPLRLFLLWSLFTLLQYCVLLPSRGHAGRYQPQLLLGFLLLGAIAARAWWPRLWARPLVLLFLLGALAGSLQAARLTGLAASHLASVHRRAARELPTVLPAAARVAAFDIGVLAYEARVDWIDLSGLCDRELWAQVAARNTVSYLRERGATHVLLPLTENDGPGSLRGRLRLGELDGANLIPTHEWASSDRRWAGAFQFSGNAARRLVLYALP